MSNAIMILSLIGIVIVCYILGYRQGVRQTIYNDKGRLKHFYTMGFKDGVKEVAKHLDADVEVKVVDASDMLE